MNKKRAFATGSTTLSDVNKEEKEPSNGDETKHETKDSSGEKMKVNVPVKNTHGGKVMLRRGKVWTGTRCTTRRSTTRMVIKEGMEFSNLQKVSFLLWTKIMVTSIDWIFPWSL